MNNSDSKSPIVLIGASVRQAAQSAQRSGRRCIAFDLFGDWDTRQVAERTFQVDDWDVLHEHLTDLGLTSNDQIAVCGGMEKRIGVIRDLEQRFTLLGTGANGIDQSNDAMLIQSILRQQGLNFPETREVFGNFENTGGWLVKPRHSAGGFKVRFFDPTNHGSIDEPGYLQQFVPGQSWSSIFYAGDDDTTLIGSTKQLVGERPFVNSRFAYCGSIGPVEHAREQQAHLLRAGQTLAGSLGLKGVFGIDWVLGIDGEVWIVEVNPRMTSSCELFELAGRVGSIVGIHGCCQRWNQPNGHRAATKIWGKAIVFSRMSVEIQVSNSLFQWFLDHRLAFRRLQCDVVRSGFVGCADIPCEGSRIPPFAPIATLFAAGDSVGTVESVLRDTAECLHRRVEKPGSEISPSRVT